MPITTDKAPDPLLPGTGVPKVCPFLSRPFSECYCLNISGANIPRIIEYCNGNFTGCWVYCRWIRQDKSAQEHEQMTP